MPEIAFCIDKNLSESAGALLLKLEFVEKENFSFRFIPTPPSLTATQLLKIATEKDLPALKWLIQEQKNNQSLNTIQVPYAKSNQALKLLIPTGKIYLHNKQVIPNLFSKREFYYLVETSSEGKTSISGRIKDDSQDFDIRDCDMICGGPPHWYIKGINLYTIHTEISWKALKQAYTLPDSISVNDINEEAEEDPDAPRVIFKGNSKAIVETLLEPTPVLILKDRTGAFAELWMDYKSGKPINFQDANTSKRNLKAESLWEKDLLETDFIRKTVGTSHYYCPMDKVSKSLTFLLEMGWIITDWKGNKVVRQGSIHLDIQDNQQSILIKGKIHYDTHETELSHVLGAFNRNERFVQLGSGIVGLLPDTWKNSEIGSFNDEGEIVGNGVKIARNKFGSLSELFNSKDSITLDSSLNNLKERLESFQSIAYAKPGINFSGELRPYQQEGLNWLNFLHDFGFHGMLADDMGLGKTVQVLAFLSQLTQDSLTLIVMPTSLLFNWKKEIERFLPQQATYLHHGPNRFTKSQDLPKQGIILTSYTTMRLDLALLSAIPFHCLILDEAQAIKNFHTLTSQAARSLKGHFRLLITGTPIENHLKELWSHFQFLMPDLLGDETEFTANIEAIESDSRYLQRIKRKIRPFIMRRKKEEVAKDLPERIEQVVWIEMPPSQRQVYDDFLSGIRGNLFKKIDSDGISKHRLEVLESILRLRQICCHPLLISGQLDESQLYQSGKLDALIQDIETAIDEGRKILVYSQFTSMLSIISKALKEKMFPYVYLDGSTIDREKVVNQFQNDPSIPIFLISLKAGGIGLNLTAADYVFLYDPWWNVAVENQAIDRAHRIGRLNTVIAKRYITIESIEEKIMKLKAAKSSLSDDLLDENLSQTNLTADDLRFLLT